MTIAGYVELDSRLVHDACDLYLIRHQARVANSQEALIQKAMKSTWYRPSRTREQAINALHGTIAWDMAAWQGSLNVQQVKELIVATKLARKVLVSSTVLKIIETELSDLRLNQWNEQNPIFTPISDEHVAEIVKRLRAMDHPSSGDSNA